MDKEFNTIEIPYTDNFSITFTYEQAEKTYNILRKLFDKDKVLHGNNATTYIECQHCHSVMRVGY